MKHWKKLTLAGAAALFMSPANATIINVTTLHGSTGDLIINNGCADEVDGPGATITGCLNHVQTSAGDVNFTSNEPIQFDTGGGQAIVKAADGVSDTLTVDPVNFGLSALILDIHAAANGYVQFCDNAGCWGTLQAIGKNGSNWFTVTFNPAGDFLTFNTFSDAAGLNAAQLLQDSRQWRILPDTTPPCEGDGCGGGGGKSVPEPTPLTLLGTALLAFGYMSMRRRRSAAL